MNTKQLVLLMGLTISTSLFPLNTTPDKKTIKMMLKEINSRIQEHKDHDDYMYQAYSNYGAGRSIPLIHRIHCKILERKKHNNRNEYCHLIVLQKTLEEMKKNTSTKEALYDAIDSTFVDFTWYNDKWKQDRKKELCDFIKTGELAMYSNLVSQKTEKYTVDSSTHNVFI